MGQSAPKQSASTEHDQGRPNPYSLRQRVESWVEWTFYCLICRREVSMRTRGSEEIDRQIGSPRHWNADVRYTFYNGLAVFNCLRDPMTLSGQEADYLLRVCSGRADEFSFSEDLLPQCTRESSSNPLMKMVNFFMELLLCGGSYVLLRRLRVRIGCVCFRRSSAKPCFLVCYALSIPRLSCSARKLCHSIILTALSTVLFARGRIMLLSMCACC